jgi:putative flippase GtrA
MARVAPGSPPSSLELVDTLASSIEVVLPVYNEERELGATVAILRAYLQEHLPFPWTITIADNASTDGTAGLADRIAAEDGRVRALHLDRKGRGLALRTAWSKSRADVVVYMDVDLSTDLDGLLPLIAPLVNGHSDIAIGSRLAPGARTVRSPQRELISRSYIGLVHLLHGSRFSDAQCGFKAARTDAVRPLLEHIRDNAWFFDTELLLLAEHNGLRIHEVPVDWIEDTDSRVRIGSTALADIRGLIRVAHEKAVGEALVPGLPRRPPPHALHPGITVPAPRSWLGWQLVCFAFVGVLSTALNAALFALLRTWSPVVVANLLALIVSTVFNTEANRRLSFAGWTGSAARAQAQGLAVFVLYYCFTSACLLGLGVVHPDPGRWLEVAVLLGASAVGMVGRFLLLRSWVFKARGAEGGN